MNDDAVTLITDAAMPDGHGLALTLQQRRVRDELMRLDAHLVDIYVGGIYALHQRRNPDRFAQAAHSLRELLERMAESLGGPITGGPELHKEVRDLRAAWPDDGIPSVFGDRTVSPVLDKALRNFLKEAKAFFVRFDTRSPNRREQTVRLFAMTDPRQRRLSPPIEKVHVDHWLELRRKLLAITHHGTNPTESDFQHLCDRLDSLLIERLRPKAFEQQDEIDRIIAQGERHP